jgi:hypothetical protein
LLPAVQIFSKPSIKRFVEAAQEKDQYFSRFSRGFSLSIKTKVVS